MSASGNQWLPLKILFVLAIWSTNCQSMLAQQQPNPNPLAQLAQAIEQGDLASGVAIAQQFDEQFCAQTDTTIPLARLARSLEKGGQIEESANFYARAVTASQCSVAAELPERTKIVLRLAAGSVIAQSSKPATAIAVVQPVLSAADDVVSEQQYKQAVLICLTAGATALSQSDLVAASAAYSLALQHCDQDDRPAAMLGKAWTAVLDPDKPSEAIDQLADFCRQFPSHPSAPQAVGMCIECWRRSAGDETETALPPVVQSWLIQRSITNECVSFDATFTVSGLLAASKQNEPVAWSNLVKRLFTMESAGQAVSDALAGLPEADAERLAIAILSAQDSKSETQAAAARWAGRTNRWSLLASAAEHRQPVGNDLTGTVDRLMAEAPMQMGQVEESIPWWNHLVDIQSVDDFSTLLRCAEAETAAGDDIQRAAKRVAAAREAAGQSGYDISLVDLLDAELKIRSTDFADARTILESIVRNTESHASIRSRAQWLIGETHYLQRNFVEAIDAYRIVEGITSDQGQEDPWVSASLVQAAKSFEQLGRTREAALCYGNLLQRFPDSAHARLARQRLAALDPELRDDQNTDTPKTIRR